VDPDAPAPAPFLAAAVQFEPRMFDTTGNVERLLALCAEAAEAGAKLIVTPEMATTGYCWHSREEIAPEVEPIPGPTTERFAAFCAARGCWVVLGMPEVVEDTGVFYNSAVLIGPEGVAGLYRKTHAYISDPKWAKDGDLGLPVFDTPLGRIAIAICMDAAYPETVRVPALRGADVVCFPTNWLSEKAPSPTWWARAVESGVFLIAANRWGCERGVQFDGGSCLIAPDGEILAARDAGDGVVLAEIDPARARDKRPGAGASGCPGDLLAARRPEAYGTLTLNTYGWKPGEFHGLYGHRPLPEGRVSRAAVLQMDPQPGAAGANLAAVAAALAAHPGLDLLVAPEFALCGRPRSPEEARRWAEPVPGPATTALAAIAAAANAHVVAGLVERAPAADRAANAVSPAGSRPDDPAGDAAPERRRPTTIAGDSPGDRFFNTVVLVGPNGLVGAYRALHLADADAAWATPGDRGLPTFDTPVGRIGLLTGFDLLFPEAARMLALDGADVIACAADLAWPGVRPWGATGIPMPGWIEAGPTPDHFHLARERSRENNTFLLFANTPAAGGWSGVFSAGPEDEPRADALVLGAAPGLAAAAIDTTDLDSRYATNPVRAKDLLRMRMPIWYDPLQAPKASWLLAPPVAADES
jgi:predicted amidohydrolase